MLKNFKKILDKDLAIILFFGLSSGLPYALTGSTLKLLLGDKGFDLQTIGFFSLVGLPYTLKFFFAPIMDSFKVPFLTKIFGQRRSWIILSQAFLIAFIAMLGLATISENLLAIAMLSLFVAFASASQDVVIDAYRIELIKKENQGLAVGYYIYGYRIGILISGAGALILADFLGWNVVYLFMAAFMVIGIITSFIATESRENWKQKSYHFTSWFKDSVIDPFIDFSKHQKWVFIIAFIILFKLGDAFAGSLSSVFLREIGFSKTEIASIVKSFGLFATLLGVFIGGLLIKQIGLFKSLWIAGISQMISNLAFSYLAHIGPDISFLYFTIFIENFSGGIGDAVFVAYLSSLCNIAFSATQYALLASLATFANNVLSSSAGIFAKTLGWHDFFILSAALAIPGLIFLFLLTVKNATLKKPIEKQ